MSERKVRATEITCDGCGKSWIYTLEPPNGYYGAVHEVHDAGGTARVKWYACNFECIKDAVINALENDRRSN